jgi:bla regulator protein blaR1
MTNTLWLRDVGAFSLQVSAVVAAGAGVAFACRLHRPGATLFFWRALLLACVILPFCQPWTVQVSPVGASPMVSAAISTEAAAVARAVSTDSPRRLEDILIAVLLAGVALRSVWLAMGALALRRLRRGASPLAPLPPTIRDAQDRVGAAGRILISDRASGPMTFGLFRPVVLLPTDVRGMAPHIQEAIAYHELIHVRRRDWLDELIEEAVRTIFWFHPAVWWLIGRIRLSREQVVDQAVIRFTQSRERYVDALLVMALRKAPFSLAPAPTFLRRSLLKKRVAHIMQETTMTTRRLIASLTASAAVVGLAGAFAVRSFPLQAQAQVPGAPGQPVQVSKGGEHLMHGELPEYPARAIEQKVEGDVILDLAVDDRGEVSDARVLSGPDELRRASLESVLQWHYAPAAVSNTSTQVVLRFHLPPPEAASGEGEARTKASSGDVRFAAQDGRTFKLRTNGEPLTEKFELSPAEKTERQMTELRQALADPQVPAAEKEELKQKYAEAAERMSKIRAERESTNDLEPERVGLARTPEGAQQLVHVRSERVSESMVSAIMAQAGVSVGDRITEDALKQLRQIASKADEHIRVELGRDEGGAVLTFITR